MKNKEQLIRSLDITFHEYAENLWKALDPNLVKSEFDERWEWSMNLKSDLIDAEDILCVRDMMEQSEHKLLFEVKERF